jgi:glycosyltransferase involved in cell wall biosynthesis
MVLNRFGLDACRFGFLKPLANTLFKALGRPAYFSKASRAQVAEMVSLGDVLLPNSFEEAEMLARYLGKSVSEWNVRPVVNAVDAAVFCSSEVPWASREGIIQAGNFEAVKNHMAVLRDDVPVVLVGNPTNRDYVRRIRKRAGGNVRIIDRSLPQAELAREFHRCKVHVNPSFRESPGLSTMEALASGCRVVVSDKPYCPIDTYFSDLLGRAVFCCDPYSPASVRKAVDKALIADSDVDLTDWLKKFSWEEAARQTYAAYAEILGR